MVGSMLAGTNETPGEADENGRKEFRGMASTRAQQVGRGSVSAVEGIATTVEGRGSVSSILECDSNRPGKSGCSYSGVNRLQDLQDAARYVTVSQAASGAKPHAI